VNITAVVLSAHPYARRWPGIEVLVHHAVVRDAREFLLARFAAALKVRTRQFFFLDDDDDLPEDYLDVLARCAAPRAALAYTDELIRLPDGTQYATRRAPYSQAAHLRDPQLLHHLVLCDSSAAHAAIERLPRLHYHPEMLLGWELAKQGAHFEPAIGYVWNKRSSGMHTWPSMSISQMQAVLWCKAHP